METLSQKQVLVTGGAGFIGSHIVDHLLTKGARVRVLDDLATGKRENISHTENDIELIEGSVLDDGALAQSLAGVEYVFHQAAIPSVPKSVRDPLASHEANATGTLKLLLAARDAKVKRVVYAASSSIYGDTPTLPKREDMPPNPISPYALQKFAGERYALQFYRLYGLEAVSLRYFNVYGPRQNPESEYAAAIPRFLRAIKHGEQVTIFGDGSTTRDFSFVSDVAEANALAAVAPEAAGHIFNIAGGRQISLNELVALMEKITGQGARIEYAPPREGDVQHSLADIGKARSILNFEPKVSLEEGIARTAAAIA